MAQISGAVVAPGRVSVESEVKKVQHREGGTVSELYVSEGDRVAEGAILARLDSTVVRANLESVDTQQMQLTARRLRLEAERDGRDSLAPAPADIAGPPMAPMMAAERNLLRTRRDSREQKKAELRQQIDQSLQEIEGLRAQVAAQTSQHRLIEVELVGLHKLYDQDYVPITRINEQEREASRLEGERGELQASIAKAEARIAEIRINILETDSDALTQGHVGLERHRTETDRTGPTTRDAGRSAWAHRGEGAAGLGSCTNSPSTRSAAWSHPARR